MLCSCCSALLCERPSIGGQAQDKASWLGVAYLVGGYVAGPMLLDLTVRASGAAAD